MRSEPFDSTQWIGSPTKERDAIRWKMRVSALGLINSKRITTATDAIEKFGPPDMGGEIPGRWRYKLRPQFVPVDDYWLALRIGANGIIIHCGIEVD